MCVLSLKPLPNLTSFVQVQLSTTHTVSLDLPSTISVDNAAQSASKILALIETEEGKYQTSLNEAYQDMGEKTFKGLRRALPMTRAKLDWDRVCSSSWICGSSLTVLQVLGYKLGAEISASKGGFSSS